MIPGGSSEAGDTTQSLKIGGNIMPE